MHHLPPPETPESASASEAASASASAPAPAPVFQAKREKDGQSFAAPADLPVLVAAEHAGWLPVSSCRNGTCRSCICQLVSGKVGYRIAWPGLSAEEKKEGWILPCVAYPQSDLVLRMAG